MQRALADGGLVAESERAASEGLTFVMPVGPRGAHGPSRDVLVRVVPTRQEQGHAVVALRWEAVGPTGKLFPSLDGNLTLTTVDDGTSLLSIVASYRAPLGALGEALDRSVLSRVASATVKSLLDEVVAKIGEMVAEDEGFRHRRQVSNGDSPRDLPVDPCSRVVREA